MKAGDSLSSAVQSLQSFLSQGKAETEDMVRERAVQQSFPYPELAAQVTRLLGRRSQVTTVPSPEDISDAFMALLMDAEAVEALGGKKSTNPWRAVRDVIRNTGKNVGASLMDVYAAVRSTGMGYAPTLLELSSELGALLEQAMAAAGNEPDGIIAELKKLAKQQDIPPWKLVLALAWFKRRRKDATVPTDEDLEDLFADQQVLEELTSDQPDGPWEVYNAQSDALRTLRFFGKALVEIAEEIES